MRPTGSTDLISDRRRRALALLDQGYSLNAVGRQIGCAPISVLRWRDERKRNGEGVFHVRFSNGRPSKLSEKQKKRLEKMLLKGAMANGFRTELWTTSRIAQMIKNKFAVRYHPDHIGRVMTKMGWSTQKPDRRAIERNEPEIKRWKAEEWPRIKKKLKGWVPISFSQTNRDSC